MWQLRIAMHCNLRSPDAEPVFNRDANPKFEVSQLIQCFLIGFLLLIFYVMLRPWPLTLNVCSISAVMWSNHVPNLGKIEQSAVKLLWFQYLTIWPLTCATCCTRLSDNFSQVWSRSTSPIQGRRQGWDDGAEGFPTPKRQKGPDGLLVTTATQCYHEHRFQLLFQWNSSWTVNYRNSLHSSIPLFLAQIDNSRC